MPTWFTSHVNTNDVMPMWLTSHVNPNDVMSGMYESHTHAWQFTLSNIGATLIYLLGQHVHKPTVS